MLYSALLDVAGTNQNNTWNLCCNMCCKTYSIDISFAASVFPEHAYDMGGTNSCFYNIQMRSKLQKTGSVTYCPKKK